LKKRSVKRIILLTSLLLLLVISCEINEDSAGNFSIYMLKDDGLSYLDIKDVDIDDLELKDDPWISSDDIKFYDFSTHNIYLNKSKSRFFDELADSSQFYMFNFSSKPFVVNAGNQRIYIGSFFSAVSSMSIGKMPTISDGMIFYYPDDIIPIEFGSEQDDPRRDPRIRNALIQDNIYHGGLSVELLDVLILENSDISTIQYTFRLTNTDSEDLYVFDPDKAGSAVFHYYTNGIDFWDKSTGKYLWSQYKISENAEWSTDWYRRLDKGKSMTRTVTLKGYPQIPPGNYKCYFYYNTPIRIDKDHRTIHNSRIWLGRVWDEYDYNYTE